jgi:Ca2+-binding RTX toxin-like protein
VESEVTVRRVNQDLEVRVAGETDKVTVKSFFAGVGPTAATNPLQRIFFQSGNKTWDLAKIQGLAGGQDNPPQLVQPLLDQTVQQGAAFNYVFPAAAFVDPDAGDVLTYSATYSGFMALPAWLTFNPNTRTFIGTAPIDFVGTLDVRVLATDSKGNTAYDVFDLTVAPENRTVTGTAGADVLQGYSGDDTLYGLGGNDSLTGNHGSDRLDGGAGLDTLRGGMGSDTYVVDASGDVVLEADDIPGIDTIESSITLTLPSGIEGLTLLGTENIHATGNALSNLIVGNAGNNRLDGGPAPTVWYRAASDILRGEDGDDTYVVRNQSYNTVTLEELANEGVDTVEFTSETAGGYDLPANIENIVLLGNSLGAQGNDLNNVITGNNLDNFLSGSYGADTLYGFAGNDILEGGLEFGDFSDVLDGGLGNDTYRYQLGSGQDVVVESLPDARADKLNVLFVYGRGFASENIPTTLVRVGDDLEVRVGGGTDKVTVKAFFAGSGPDNPLNPVQRIDFGDGTSWNIADILSRVTGVGPSNTTPVLNTPLSDQSVQQGTPFSYSVPTGAFTDADAGDSLNYSASLSNSAALPSWLSFNPSTRTFSGMAPTDSVGTTSIKVTATDAAGASASDVFDWAVAAENKTLTGTGTADVLVGYSGNDSLSGAAGNDSLSGNAGNDLLDGGAGADVIDGGSGNDVVLFGLGDGQDAMQEAVADSAAGKLNILRFKAGVLASQVSVSRVGADLEVLIAGGSDKVTVKSFFTGTGPLAATNPLQRIEFADGTVWDIAHIQSSVNVPVNTAPAVNTPLVDRSVQQGAAVNYTVPVSSFVDADTGDVLSYSATLANGAALPSWLSFNASARTFTGTAPSSLGATSIKVVATDSAGASASDVFDLTVIAADNTLPAKNLVGTSGNDTLFGDTGNDVLDGGSGNDTYY